MSLNEPCAAAVVPSHVLWDFEADISAPGDEDLASMQKTPEAAGVEFTNGERPGVSLRKQ
jgi:hypothetical protein